MKIKILKNYIDLESAINRSIKDMDNIIDIKYCVDNGKTSALIIYDEKR